MRDAWSHLVGKCSETPPSNIETRTHQVDRRGERKREGAQAAYTQNGRMRNSARASASYLCKRQFPVMSEARSLIFPAFCEHITRHSGDIFAQATLSLTFPASTAFLSSDDDTRQANANDVSSYGASRRVAIPLFRAPRFSLFLFLFLSFVPVLFHRRLRGGTAADIARVKSLYRSDSFTLRELFLPL